MNCKLLKRIAAFVMMLSMTFNMVSFAEAPVTYNITNNYYGTNNGYNPYPQNTYVNQTYFYIQGYDRVATQFYNGEAMMTRYPVITGNNYYLASVANGIIGPAYQSIENWCRSHLISGNVQDIFLNSAYIESQTESTIVLIVNCAYKKRGILDGHTEFRCTLNLNNNRYNWVRVGYENTNRQHLYDRDEHYYP